MEFSSLALAPQLQSVVAAQGYTTPTPIQAKAIPAILSGSDLLGCAQTGTGKTAAFALPILHALFSSPPAVNQRGVKIPRAIILSPTRELATQIAESFATYGRETAIRGTTIYGGMPQARQVRALRAGVDVVVATPGRLRDLTEQGYMDFSAIEIFVLDEADRMLDMGFIKPIREIAAQLPPKKQTLMFSATMPPEIMKLADSLLRNPVKVSVAATYATADKVEQSLYMVPRMKKQSLLHHLIEESSIQRAVVFTKTKHGADKVAKRLAEANISAIAIHGDKAQHQRERALDAFKAGKMRVLVATDVAARGLDVDGISHVFNYDLPMEPEGYVHRIGRTGRAGNDGIAISFCDSEERGLLRQIERLLRKQIPQARGLPSFPDIMVEPRMSGDNFNDSRDQRDQPREQNQDRSRSSQRSQGNFERPAHAPAHGTREPGTRFPKNRQPHSQERAQHPLDGESLASPGNGASGPRGGRNFRGNTVAGNKRTGFKGKSSSRPGPR